MSHSFTLFLRSLIFNVLFYSNMMIVMIIAIPTLALPYPFLRAFGRYYAWSGLWLLRVLCGVSVEWRGREKIPKGGCIVACKHQSMWETFAVFALFWDPTIVIKRELMWVPLFRWYALKARLIPIDRGTRVKAIKRMTTMARKEAANSRQIVIFPEGTRRPPGAEPRYMSGVAFLYGELATPCVPVALNSGLFWPRRSLLRFPGTVLVEVLDPIPPGLDRRKFLARLQNELEKASARLVAEGRRELEGCAPQKR